MARISARGGLVVALLASGFVFGACKKEEKAAGTGSGSGSGSATTGSGSATTGSAGSGSAMAEAGSGSGSAVDPGPVAPAKAPATGDYLGLLPKDSEIVMGVNFQQVQKSALWKQLVEPKLMQNNDFLGDMQKFKDKCGFDPMTSVISVSAGLKNLGPGTKPEGVVVVNGLDKAKVTTCLEKHKDDIAKKGNELKIDGDVMYMKEKDGDTAAMHFVTDQTMIVVIGPLATADGVKAAASGTSALKTSPAFVEMYGKINTSDSMWGLANCNSKIFEDLRKNGINCKAVFGSLNVTDGVTMDVRTRALTPDQAVQLANMAKGGLPQAQAFVDKIEITTDGSDMKTSVVISQQKLMGLISMFGGGGRKKADPAPPAPPAPTP